MIRQLHSIKCALIVTGIILCFFPAFAQRNNIYVDAGISLARFHPGTSTTYNFNIARFIGVGVGFQGYDYHATMTNFEMIPAAYGEIRFNIRPRKRNQYFIFVDKGMNFYTHRNDYWIDDNIVYRVKGDNGTYSSLGFGYLRRSKKAGWTHYYSLKMITNTYTATTYKMYTAVRSETRLGDATLVASFGFRF